MSEWVSFAAIVIVSVTVLYLPGYLLSRIAGVRKTISVAIAPVFSIIAYCLLGILYTLLDIPCSAASIMLPLLLLGMGVNALFFLKQRRKNEIATFKEASFDVRHRKALLTVLSYLLFGILFGTVFFLLPLDGPSSSVQTYDNVFHFGLVRSFLESGSWSTFDTSLYLNEAIKDIAPISDAAYYPAAWHTVVSLVVSATDCSIGMAANAANFVITCIVYPLAWWALIDRIFRGHSIAHIVGAIVPAAVGLFPWMLVDNWPLYPNTLSMALLPALVFCFIETVESKGSSANRLRYGLLFVACCACQVFNQPNTIFSAAVFLAPYCVYAAGSAAARFSKKAGREKSGRLVAGFGFAVFTLAVWLICYRLPFLAATVSYHWDPIQTPFECLKAIASFSFVGSGRQPIMAILIVCGICYSVYRIRYIWVSFSYLLSALLYFAAATLPEIPLRHILTGFWYTDPYRLAALAGFCAVPVAVLGLCSIIGFINLLNNHVQAKLRKKELSVDYRYIISCWVVCLCFAYLAVSSGVSGMLGLYENALMLNDANRMGIYDKAEMGFVGRVQELVPEGALIINAPYDGSIYAYGLSGINTYYRIMSGYGTEREHDYSETIRLGLSAIATDNDVRDAVASIGAEYVLIFHRDPDFSRGAFPDYIEEQWTGIDSINDETPGFELVLADGDMRLYRIELL